MSSDADSIIAGFQTLGSGLTGLATRYMDDPNNQQLSPYQKHIAAMLEGKLHPRDAATLAKAEKIGLLGGGQGSAPQQARPQIPTSAPLPGLAGQAVSTNAADLAMSPGPQGLAGGDSNRVETPYTQQAIMPPEDQGPSAKTRGDYNTLLQTAGMFGREKDPTLDLLKILASNQRADASNQTRRGIAEMGNDTRRGIAEGQLNLGQARLAETKARNNDLHDEALARLRLGREKFDYAQSVGGDRDKSASKYLSDLMSTKVKLLGDQAKQTSSFAAGTPEAQEFTERTNAIIQELDSEIQSVRAIIKPAWGKGSTQKTTRVSGSSGGGQAGQNDAVYIVSPSGEKATISRKQAAAALAQNPGSTIQEIPKK